MATGKQQGPRSLSPVRRKILLRALADGVRASEACRMANVRPKSFYDWIKKGRAGDPVYAELAAEIEAVFTPRSRPRR